jgi:hypothetical protein
MLFPVCDNSLIVYSKVKTKICQYFGYVGIPLLGVVFK